MQGTRRLVQAGVLVALAASASLNAFLAWRGWWYYAEAKALRLDPLGLQAFPEQVQSLRPPVIVFCGDSRAANWPAPEQVATGTVVNRGIDSQTTAQVVGRFRRHVAPLAPQVIVFQVGVNDLASIALFPEQRDEIIRNCQNNIDQLVRMAVETDARVVLTTVFPIGKPPLGWQSFWAADLAAAVDEVNAHLRTLASGRVTVFDTARVLADSNGKADPRYSRDYLHLNRNGYAALNRAMADILAAPPATGPGEFGKRHE